MTSAAPAFTLVSFHAHPDDEALLTGGTLARAAAEGHRVVLVVATAGEAGLAAPAAPDGPAQALGARRRAELDASAAALGVARVVVLGYADSGYGGPGAGNDRPAFADVDPDRPAAELAQVLVEEDADVLTTYDPAGGYGHRDHVQVHEVGRRAAALAGTPVVLEATVDRTAVSAVVRLLRSVSRVLPLPHLPDLTDAFTARAEVTHRVDVRAHLEAKRRALAAHHSQTTGGPRTVALLLALPRPLSTRVLGREWFREVGRVPGSRPLDDVFATTRRRRIAADRSER